MSDSKQVSRIDIDKITFKVPMRDQAQRTLVREHLYALHDRNDGILYKESFHRDLAELFLSNKISENELHALERAFFG